MLRDRNHPPTAARIRPRVYPTGTARSTRGHSVPDRAELRDQSPVEVSCASCRSLHPGSPSPRRVRRHRAGGHQVDRGDLPPRYDGTIDATPLFVILLEQAWRWGLDPAAVEALLPNAEAALAWMRDGGDPDGGDFLRYVALGEGRLANQGRKDSGDAISFADGRLDEAPIALCEV